MKNKLLLLVVLVLCSFTLIGCKKEVTVKSISVITESVPSFIIDTEVESSLKDIKLSIVKTDDSKEEVSISSSMISTSDLSKLQTVGNQTISITYEGQTVEVTLRVVNYTTTVVYPDNAPVTTGVTVQWCEGDICFIPEKVNSNGQAGIDLDEGEFYIHLNNIPDGYTYDPNAYVTSPANKHVTIKLISLSAIASGDGSKENPHVVSESAYTVTFNALGNSGLQYFSFTPETAGTYDISSLAVDKLAINPIDPYIGFLGTSNDLAGRDVSANISGVVNFTHTFEAEAGTTYYFVIMLSTIEEPNKTTQFPATFDILISK